MFSVLIVGVVLAAQAKDDTITAAKFSRLMEPLTADMSSVSFSFKGVMRGIPRSLTAEETERIPGHWAGETVYQGAYAYRADGATRLDSYEAMYEKAKVINVHQLAVSLNRKLSRLSLFQEERAERLSGNFSQ